MDYDTLLSRHRAEFGDAQFQHAKRLTWSRERIAEERQRGLRELLFWAVERSPWHRERLSGIAFDEFTESDLPSLPSMTKDELMANFDRIITDPRLSLQLVNDHVDSLTSDAYLLSEYRAFATGGSSGRRGVFVYGWDEWTTLASTMTRWLAQSARETERNEASRVVGILAANAMHVSGTIQDFLQPERDSAYRIAASAPVAEIVARLNELQPDGIATFPSTLRVLTDEARAGRLRIAPSEIQTGGELLSPTLRTNVLDLWGIEIYDCWATSEGVDAFPCRAGATQMHLPDDLVIVEPVDTDGAPVPYGEAAAKILVTRLYNKTQPLIRYELTDSMTLSADRCQCGSAYSHIGDLRGRLSDSFVYPDGTVLARLILLFEALERHRDVIEFQVAQTAKGANVIVYTSGKPDLEALRRELVEMLAGAGLADPEVTVSAQPEPTKLHSGKLRRFIPLVHE